VVAASRYMGVGARFVFNGMVERSETVTEIWFLR
jgi:hypothetical protein